MQSTPPKDLLLLGMQMYLPQWEAGENEKKKYGYKGGAKFSLKEKGLPGVLSYKYSINKE